MTSDFPMFADQTISSIKGGLAKLANIESNNAKEIRISSLSYASVRDLSIAEIDRITAMSYTPTHRVSFTLNELIGALVSFTQSRMYLKNYQALSTKVAQATKGLIAAIPADAQWAPVAALNEFVAGLA